MANNTLYCNYDDQLLANERHGSSGKEFGRASLRGESTLKPSSTPGIARPLSDVPALGKMTERAGRSNRAAQMLNSVIAILPRGDRTFAKVYV